MGISDDISRKRSRPVHHNTTKDVGDIFYDHADKKTEPAKTKEVETKIKIDKSPDADFFDKKKNHDDFFPLVEKNKEAKPTKKEVLPDPNKKLLRKKIWRTVRFYLIMVTVVLIAIANQSSLQKYFINLFSGSKATTSDDSSVKIVPKDYSTPTTGTTPTTTPTTAPATTTTTTPTTTTTTAPAATTPTYNKSTLKIEILNGNGIKKDGAATKTLLTNAGFVVAKTANAANFNYTTTYIYYKTGELAQATDVKTALTTKNGTLENNDKICGIYDIVIILGDN